MNKFCTFCGKELIFNEENPKYDPETGKQISTICPTKLCWHTGGNHHRRSVKKKILFFNIPCGYDQCIKPNCTNWVDADGGGYEPGQKFI